MRATVMHAPGDVRIENIPDPTIEQPTDALIRVTSACICGSDLWPYKDLAPGEPPRVMGHEAVGVVEATGRDVRSVKPGDVVVMPFAFSDGTCDFCEHGLQTACIHGGFFGNPNVPGAQAEAIRVPLADGTLYRLPVGEDAAPPLGPGGQVTVGQGGRAAMGDVVDLVRSAGLLITEIVGGHADDHQSALAELGPQLLQAGILRGEAALRGGVDH